MSSRHKHHLLSLFQKNPFSVRIFAAVFIPLFGLLATSIYVTMDKLNRYDDAKVLKSRIVIHPFANQLVHHLQSERDLTMAHLSSGKSMFQDLLLQQRTYTDNSLDTFYSRLEHMSSADFSVLSAERILKTRNYLSNLAKFRKSVGQSNVSASDAMLFYNNTADDILQYINIEANDLTSMTLAIDYFTQAKNMVGLQRALGAIALEQDHINPRLIEEINSVYYQQKVLLKQFEKYASSESKASYEQILQSEEFSKVSRMQKDILQQSEHKQLKKIDSVQWFNAMSEKMDLLQHVETQLENDFSSHIDMIHGKAKRDLSIVALSFICIILTTVLIMSLVSHSITQPLNQVTRYLHALAQGDTSVNIEEMETNVEMKEMLEALLVFKNITIELKQLNQQLLLATDVAGIGIWVYNTARQTCRWDKQAARLFQHNFGEELVSYTTWKQCIYDGDLAAFDAAMTNTIEECEEFRLVVRVKTDNNNQRYLQLAGMMTRDETTNVKQIIGVCIDITEEIEARHFLEDTNKALDYRIRQRTQELEALLEQVQESEASVQAIVDNMDDGVIIFGKDNTIQTFFSSATHMFGYETSEALGKTVTWLLPGIPSLDELDRIHHVSQHQQIPRTDPVTKIYARRKDGSEFPAEIRLSRYAINEKNHYSVIVRDITEQKKLQLALFDAAERSEMANAAKSAFIANMSHEIRTPLNSIIGMAYLALQEQLDKKSRNYIDKIHISGNHLLNLINDLLDISKIESGMLDIESSRFELEDITARLHTMFASAAEQQGILFDIAIDKNSPAVLIGDAQRLTQILVNLTGNALKFTNEGSVSLTIELEQTTPSHHLLTFMVKDTGIGVPEEKIDEIFDAFVQGDNSITRKYGGSGLGLMICKKFVELMNGEIGVRSELGKGSEYWFTIPFVKDNNKQPINNAPATYEHIDYSILANAEILLAEDNLFNQEVAQDLLQKVGAKTVVANNGIEVLDLMKNNMFDCILMDVQMPEMGGLETTRIIRQTSLMSSVNIIAMTANASGNERKACLEAGMNDFITKPVKPEVLYSTLSKWLTKTVC